MSGQEALPWYRHFWVWFIIFPPAAAVVGGVVTAWIAGPPPAQVVDDYGQIAMVTAQRAARDRRAADYGVLATISLPADGERGDDTVQVDLDWADPAFVQPLRLALKFVHPTRSQLDRTVIMSGEYGRYTGAVTLRESRYYAELSDPEGDWRLTGEIRAGAANAVLRAGRHGTER